MKKLTSLIVAAALIAPGIAAAQRHTTPGTAERHAANLKGENERPSAQREAGDMARNEEENNQQRIPAAKAGKVNTAAPAAGRPN